ncbi:uncharacterized protein LOC127150081 isoform X2 [Cucumis melo]|uniref:Uncharacterized protein LOC127150081 isoform X2 n=1 Tax=Cucumis melo TaxID=3656 RepID=A0ABM3KYK4_CUCME|nr:uncharacterized protein LOC127150081 isoform X2 [Cucumis melo]XP_050942856.1 uncharacterized protein LOC127150081 isoform X2 [Cucumis melo]XP_050942857.1 uncharacterized protein LOC127150081 isoform X2 [Cucumis melo]XP_050942858.1 uncharacterized protein LOC127150081 isoform X2 [Cucumis melo]XP_050942859.1 uncharacterized protein LOC127150081 isoform X2 [Cucumis melo]XP_050942860.1 uncharacterized protein LOC127150081 isoform X2 [Cucumis melo]
MLPVTPWTVLCCAVGCAKSSQTKVDGVSYLCWIWWGKANTRMVKDKDIEDEEDVKAIARLFADMGDSYVELIATSNRFCYVVEVLHTLNWILPP